MSKPEHDPKMRSLRGALRRWRRRLKDERLSTRKVRRARKAVAGLEARIARAQARRKGLDHVSVLDGTPIILGLKLVLLDARQSGKWNGTLSSADRRTVIRRLLHRLGKKTQAALWRLFQEGKGAPANPPDRGTHQLIGDGTVGELFEELAWWRMGMDTSLGPELRAGLRELGYEVIQPYSSEEWHSNMTENPHDRLIERGQV